MRKIKLTNISPSDIKGGASLAGYRLHKEFLKNPEIDSVLFTHQKYTQDKEIVKFSNSFFWPIERVLNKLGYFTGLQYLLSINWLPLLFKKRFRETDIFLIRNIHGGFLPLWFPFFLSEIAPVVWRLPDMWPFTGHCCYSYECEKWKVRCEHCPHLRDYPALFLDSTRLLFKLKKFFYQKSNLFLVAPSEWMINNVQASPILKQFSAFCIPIGVNTEVFKPQPKNKKLSLVFVSGGLKDKRKGAEILPQILFRLNDELRKLNISVDVFWTGENDYLRQSLSNINNVFLGLLQERQMADCFARAHLHILPTLADNLPNTILESLSCATPVVVFDVGGCKEAVQHLRTGYLVKAFEIDDFVRGILYFLEDTRRIEYYGQNGRELVKSNFNQGLQKERYLTLFKNIIAKEYESKT